METSLPTPTTARVYVNLPEGISASVPATIEESHGQAAHIFSTLSIRRWSKDHPGCRPADIFERKF